VLALEPGDPRSIGRYALVARIGSGGMAISYLGRSSGGRPVAIKVMHADLASDTDHRERFRREVAATRAAGGRYSPSVLDADPDARNPWLATEFLPSVTLREAVSRFGPLPVESVWPLAAGLAEALASIHRAGIVHLDVTPANVLLTLDGPRIIDFGIAAALGAAGENAGSWGYMSREQLSGEPASPASDVYSLGATLAFACTATHPGALDTIADERLLELIEQCLQPDPAARPTVSELIETVDDDAPTLPPDVVAEITLRTSEARNPPIPLTGPPPALSRRAVLLAGGAIAVSAGAAALLATVLNDPRPEPGRAVPGPTTNSPPRPSIPVTQVQTQEVTTRTLEFYVFGSATVRSLTTTVNGGDSMTVTNVALPWRRIVQIPPRPQRTSYRIDWDLAGGSMNYVIITDGNEGAQGITSTSGKDGYGGEV
jgi:serine/threonine protein kinase